MSVVAIGIAAFALIFSVASFWWLYARRGKLVVPSPHAFVIAGGDSTILLRFPLVFFNSGAVATVVRDLQLRFAEDRFVLPLRWRYSYSALTGGSEVREYASPFPIPSRQAVPLNIEFWGSFPGLEVVAEQTYTLQIEALFAHRETWQTLLRFDLPVPPNPWHWLAVHPITRDDETTERAMRATEELLWKLNAALKKQSPTEE
jgi:hypothetical protein